MKPTQNKAKWIVGDTLSSPAAGLTPALSCSQANKSSFGSASYSSKSQLLNIYQHTTGCLSNQILYPN